MKKFLLILLLAFPSLMFAQLFTAQQVTVQTTSPDSCTTINIDVQAYMGCINFTVGAGTYSINGSNIDLQINCTGSFICAGAISYPVTSFALTGVPAGNYTITATAFLDRVQTNSISGGNITVASCQATSIQEKTLSNLRIYPNPTSDRIFIDELSNSNKQVQIQLFDLVGKEQSIPLTYSNSRLQMDVSKLNSGIYFLQITEGEEKVIKKILVD